MKRSIWFWLCFVMAIIFAIYFASRTIITIMGHGKVSVVKNINISADTTSKDFSDLISATSIIPGTPSYSIDLDAMNQRIKGVPGIKDSAVRRMPNGNIYVRVSTHRAIALWTDGENYFPLSADGTIVNRPTTTKTEQHIVFRGNLPNDINDITKIAQSLADDIEYIEWIENRRWNFITNTGIKIMLPEANPASAVSYLLTLNKNHKILAKNVTIIDMRDDARILIK